MSTEELLGMFWNRFDMLYTPERCMKCGKPMPAIRDEEGIIVGYGGSAVIDTEVLCLGQVFDREWHKKHYVGGLCPDCDEYGKKTVGVHSDRIGGD